MAQIGTNLAAFDAASSDLDKAVSRTPRRTVYSSRAVRHGPMRECGDAGHRSSVQAGGGPYRAAHPSFRRGASQVIRSQALRIASMSWASTASATSAWAERTPASTAAPAPARARQVAVDAAP